jgi:hypothetical protein
MLTLTLWLLTAATPPLEVKLAAPGLTINGLDPALAGPLTDHLARAFTGVRVITPRDMAALIGLERQKELLGCTDASSSCMAELGNALGVQGVLLGDVVKLGGTVQINVRIIDPVAGRELAAASEQIDSEKEIFDALTRTGAKLREQYLAALHVVLPGGSGPSAGLVGGTHATKLRRLSYVALAAGGAAGLAGALCFVFANLDWQKLTSGQMGHYGMGDALSIGQEGSGLQTAGGVLVAVGSAALVAGLLMLIFGGSGGS